jgi:PAS domain S-box-containing protein
MTQTVTIGKTDMGKNMDDSEKLNRRILQLEKRLKRQRAKRKGIEASQDLLNVLSDVQSQFILDVEPRKLFDRLLSDLLYLTKSEYGFIGEVLKSDNGDPYLKTHAITNIAWNEKWMQFYKENAPIGMMFTNLNTLFGAVMTSGKAVISNNPAKDPRRGGLPEGHPALNAFLGLPVYRGENLVGMIGIANRPKGYDKNLVPYLEPFIASCASMIDSVRIENFRRKAEKALRKSEAKMQAIVKTAVDAIITIDVRGIVHAFNPAAEKIFGYDANEVIGKNVSMLMPHPHREHHDSYISNYLQSGVARVIGIGREVKALRKNGMKFPVELSVSEFIAGTDKFFTGILRDITERREAEAKKEELLGKIHASHENLLAILNQLRLGVITLGSDGRVTFMSRRCPEILQKSAEEAVGQNWKEICPFSDHDKKILAQVFKEKARKEQKIPITMRAPSGSEHSLEIEVHDDPRDLEGKILFIYDMSEIHVLRKQLDEKSRYQGLVGKSDPMKIVFQQLQNLAKVDSTVLILGETGTGKELVARAIHNVSARKDGPFIAVNCAGLTESLISSQLFGHKRGAFTGAIEDREGVFEAADGGTVFLDEIGEIPLSVQANLLRVLQEREIVRVGESKPISINIRLISATNRDMRREVQLNNFRSDLYYRLHVAIIKLPPLRERRGDIPLLARFFLDKLRASAGLTIENIEKQAMSKLMRYDWPGNVRELENAIEAATIDCEGRVLNADNISTVISGSNGRSELSEEGLTEILDVRSHKKQRLIDALKKTRGNRAAAAKMLGIGRTTLYRQIKEFGIIRGLGSNGT